MAPWAWPRCDRQIWIPPAWVPPFWVHPFWIRQIWAHLVRSRASFDACDAACDAGFVRLARGLAPKVVARWLAEVPVRLELPRRLELRQPAPLRRQVQSPDLPAIHSDLPARRARFLPQNLL